jgi:hypothetical protein
LAEIASVELPAEALAPPVRVSVHTAAPAEVSAGALQVAVKPAGTPEVTLMLEPEAAAGIATLPVGVAVKVTCAEEFETTLTEVGAAVNFTPAAVCTCKVTVWLAVSPSPAAVMVTVELATAAEAEAVSVTVSLFEADADEMGLEDHPAVTPAGNPVAVNVMLPLKDPPAAAVRATVLDAPCATATVLDAALSFSVGGAVTVSV